MFYFIRISNRRNYSQLKKLKWQINFNDKCLWEFTEYLSRTERLVVVAVVVDVLARRERKILLNLTDFSTFL